MGLRWDFTLFFDYHGMGWEKLIFVKNGLFPIPWYGMGIGSLKPSHAQACVVVVTDNGVEKTVTFEHAEMTAEILKRVKI